MRLYPSLPQANFPPFLGFLHSVLSLACPSMALTLSVSIFSPCLSDPSSLKGGIKHKRRIDLMSLDGT